MSDDRMREAERVLQLSNDGLKTIKILQDNKIEKLEKENAELTEELKEFREWRDEVFGPILRHARSIPPPKG